MFTCSALHCNSLCRMNTVFDTDPAGFSPSCPDIMDPTALQDSNLTTYHVPLDLWANFIHLFVSISFFIAVTKQLWQVWGDPRQPWYDSRDRTWQASGQVRSDPNILVLGLLVLYSRVVLRGPQAPGTYQHGCPQVELVKELGDEDVNLQDSRHVLFLHIPGK